MLDRIEKFMFVVAILFAVLGVLYWASVSGGNKAYDERMQQITGAK